MKKTGLLLLLVVALAGCQGSEQTAKLEPIEPTSGTFCALDGMILNDFPGPKAQIHYVQGGIEYHCDTNEMFDAFLRPEAQRGIRAMYVQDMGKADWDKPRDNWIDAKTAFYVAGSGKMGSMGATFASFSRNEDAQAFAAKHGGKVLRFDQVNIDMLAIDKSGQQDSRM